MELFEFDYTLSKSRIYSLESSGYHCACNIILFNAYRLSDACEVTKSELLDKKVECLHFFDSVKGSVS
jgi:hypothetical protein